MPNFPEISKFIPGSQCFIVSNETVASCYLADVQQCFVNKQCDAYLLKDGEEYKTIDSVCNIVDVLIKKGHRRTTTIVGLGGGVVCDIAGFVAATYQRGVNLVLIPTSLLAQVDAAIGGKNGVNHLLAKNMIGTFYQPHHVLLDAAVLITLPEQHFRSALPEVVKYGLVYDADFFDWIEKNYQAILSKNNDVLQSMIQRCVDIKSMIVEQDEKDHGVRQILNFGHTLGHALEQVSDYKLLHGQAVATGILWALTLSEKYCGLDVAIKERVSLLFDALDYQDNSGLLCTHQQAIMDAMIRDKKHGDSFTLVLLEKLGAARRMTFEAMPALIE